MPRTALGAAWARGRAEGPLPTDVLRRYRALRSEAVAVPSAYLLGALAAPPDTSANLLVHLLRAVLPMLELLTGGLLLDRSMLDDYVAHVSSGGSRATRPTASGANATAGARRRSLREGS